MATLVKEKKSERKPKKKSEKKPVKLKEDDDISTKVDISEIPSTSGANKIDTNTPTETKETTTRSVVNETADFTAETCTTKEPVEQNLHENLMKTAQNSSIKLEENVAQSNMEIAAQTCTAIPTNADTAISFKNLSAELESMSSTNEIKRESNELVCETASMNLEENVAHSNVDTDINFKNLNAKLELMTLSSSIPISDCREAELEHPDAYLQPALEATSCTQIEIVENPEPSAPIVELPIPNAPIEEEVEIKTKLNCMSLEEAIEYYNGKEIAVVKALSEQEEAIVEAGPVSGPDHPLVDLLTTFRTSIMALERTRIQLENSYDEERRFRAALWKTTKKYKHLSGTCQCGAIVKRQISYEHSEFSKNTIPIAKMRLEKFTRDVQEGYCHYQFVALKTYYQIEITLSDIICKDKSDIREALFLILQALKQSSGAPDVLPSAFLRWAVGLAFNLVDVQDIRHLLFLLHHLFRQSRSVRWAGRVVKMPVQDSKDAARVLAVLDILLNHSKIENAVECNEDLDSTEGWEELGMSGAGAVSETTLRERDLLALINALPLPEVIAKILMFNDSDLSSACKEYWGDTTGGRAMLTSCCGVRTLISRLRARPHYVTLQARLREFAAAALKGLSCLYLSNRIPYEDEYVLKILAEMEACFAAGFSLFNKENLTSLPACLLTENTARDYCLNIIVGLHDNVPKRIESLDIEMPVLPCEMRVRIVTQAAIDRVNDHELARIVLDFLFQVGVKKKIEACKGGCNAAAKESLTSLLETHMYLLPIALRIMADICQVEQLEPDLVKLVLVDKWRPSCEEIDAVLQDWSQRCPLLLPNLLLTMNYTPFTGVELSTQLHIGDWLRKHPLPVGSEWRWTILRTLHLHRVCWRLPLDAAPAPDAEPTDLFDKAHALLATSWGHSIPLICSVGVSALLDVTRARAVDGAHVAAIIMLVMASSPESISLTPQFAEVVSSLGNQSPSFISRAFGRGGVSGAEVLQRMIIAQVEGESVSEASVFRAWLAAGWARAVADVAAGPLAALDTAALIARDYRAMDAHAQQLLESSNPSAVVRCSVRGAYCAPLLCEVVVRAWHTHYELSLLPALRTELARQRRQGNKIHIDNALQKIGSGLSMDDLTIYRAATAGVAAPPAHPAHLLLWRLFFYNYLQRTMDPQCDLALGPLLFRGIMKARTLLQIKKKLQETALYHNEEAKNFKDKAETLSKEGSVEKKNPSKEKKQSFYGIFPPLLARDLTCKQRAEIPVDSDEDDVEKLAEVSPEEESRREQIKHLNNMHVYHRQAERLVTEYIGWLDADEAVAASPQHADLGRLIPEGALQEAWNLAVTKMRPTPSPELDNFPKVANVPANNETKQNSPFDIAVEVIKATNLPSKPKRWEIPDFGSGIQQIRIDNKNEVMYKVNTYFTCITDGAEAWLKKIERLEYLDAALWKDVAKMKERQAIAPIKKQCPNKCKEPVVLVVNEYEYVTNSAAAKAVEDNRLVARRKIRELCEAKPYIPCVITLLQALVRRISQYEIAYRLMEETWRNAEVCDGCTVLQEPIIDIFTCIIQRFVLSNSQLCADLINQWCEVTPAGLQQTLVGALVAPTDRPCRPVYEALLAAQLPHHLIFSYLSKFEMSKIMLNANKHDRRDFLFVILKAVTQYGAKPPESYNIVLELLGVHAAHVVTSHLLPEFVIRICKMSDKVKMPPSFWVPLNKIAVNLAGEMEFDQLGHLLRTTGSVWKMNHMDPTVLVPYALHGASLLQVLMSAFVKAGIELSYEPSRVAWYAWGALLEAWTPWILTSGPSVFMLPHFVDTVYQMILECPGGEIKILQLVFQWAVQVQAKTALLVELKRLPWDEHQWVSILCIQISLQMTSTSQSEWAEWTNDRWRSTTAETLVKLVAPDLVPAHLTNLLQLFTTAVLPTQLTEEGTRLPWWQLPEEQFGHALGKFFLIHHNPTVPYHEIPQFKMFLYASELKPLSNSGRFTACKRAGLVSTWSAAMLAPAHAIRFKPQLLHLLQLFNDLASHVQDKEVMEDVISRAMITLCTEPAAAEAIQLWCEWVENARYECVRATVIASATLTVAKYAAKLADVAIKTILNKYEEGWDWVISVWRTASWQYSTTYLCRAAPHAAYGCLRADCFPAHAAAALRALTTACNINYVEDEVIVAVWICYACSIGYDCLQSVPADRLTEEFPLPVIDFTNPDVVPACPHPAAPLVAARVLLRTLSLQPKRSLLKFITLQVDTDVQTPQHRLLAAFALCVIDESQANLSEYQSQCSALLGANNQFLSWGKAATLSQLLTLAAHLYPSRSKYFQIETEHANRIDFY